MNRYFSRVGGTPADLRDRDILIVAICMEDYSGVGADTKSRGGCDGFFEGA